MPKYYRKPRRMFRAKKRYPSKPSLPDPRTAVGLARYAYRGVKYLKNLINVEHQKIDTSSSLNISTTPAIVHCTAVAVGDAEGSRTGNSLLIKYLYLKQFMTLNPSATISRLRVVVVRDKQQIADTAPAYTDVYESVSTISLLNKNTVGRFDILYDRLFVLNTNRPAIEADKYIRLNSHVRYNGTASTDQQKGAIYLMMVSDQPTDTVTVSTNTRLMYIDN